MVAILGVSCSLAFKAGDCAFAGAVRPLHTPVAKQKLGAAVPAHKAVPKAAPKRLHLAPSTRRELDVENLSAVGLVILKSCCNFLCGSDSLRGLLD